VALLRLTPDNRSARWGTRAQVVLSTARREFSYRWIAPRSPALRVLVAPLFLGATLVTLLLGMLVVVLMFVAAAFAVILLAVANLLRSMGSRFGL
jgi:hypothetical protein